MFKRDTIYTYDKNVPPTTCVPQSGLSHNGCQKCRSNNQGAWRENISKRILLLRKKEFFIDKSLFTSAFILQYIYFLFVFLVIQMAFNIVYGIPCRKLHIYWANYFRTNCWKHVFMTGTCEFYLSCHYIIKNFRFPVDLEILVSNFYFFFLFVVGVIGFLKCAYVLFTQQAIE